MNVRLDTKNHEKKKHLSKMGGQQSSLSPETEHAMADELIERVHQLNTPDGQAATPAPPPMKLPTQPHTHTMTPLSLITLLLLLL